MNYFELFDLPVSFLVDKNVLAKKYFALQKKYHPDFFANDSDEEKEDALEKSSQVNKAFKIFTNSDETIKYVLQQKGLLEEDEKYILPADFLIEMLELNEQLTDAKMENDAASIEKIKAAILSFDKKIYEPVSKIVENYKEGSSSEKELLQVKDYYYKKKYLKRILEGMN